MFPLYNVLKTETTSKDLTVLQKTEFVKCVPSLDQEGHDLIFALIKSFYNEEEKKFIQIPYGGHLNKNNIDFELNNFPNKLKQILFRFVKIHMKRMEETQNDAKEE